MTYSDDFTLPSEYLEQLAEQGIDFIPEIIRILLNVATRAERQKNLDIAPYERSSAWKGYANGFKEKTLKTRMGEISFDVPQV